MAVYDDKQRKAVIARALEAVAARGNDEHETVTLGTGGTKQNFDLDTGGYCNRFVRQCFETALKLVPYTWVFRGPTAAATLKKLKPYQIGLAKRQPGDILGCPGDPGHIAIYVGDCYGDGRDLVAENTSSTKRGAPKAAGTKVSSFADFKAQHSAVWCYRLFPTL